MVKIKKLFEIPNFSSTLKTNISNALQSKGIANVTYRNVFANEYSSILENNFGNIDVIYSIDTSASFISHVYEFIQLTKFPDYVIDIYNFKFGNKENISKTGTESDAGSFDNDPTTNDEYRSYPFDTTASDVQSKTRSVVNGAESGTTSNTKTYNTLDSHTEEKYEFELLNEYVNMISEFINKLVILTLHSIRYNKTLVDPLTDESTLLELEF